MHRWRIVWKLIGVLQLSPSQLYYPVIHIPDQMGPTTAIYVNATRFFTTSSAHVMRARESLGSRALTSHFGACIRADRPTCHQLLRVVIQLYYKSTPWNVNPMSFPLALVHMLNYPQLPESDPK